MTRADALVNHTLDEKSKGSQLNDYYEPAQTINLQTVAENKVLLVPASSSGQETWRNPLISTRDF